MRTILHSDLNNFYASVECLRNAEIRNKPVVVVGSKEDRHGIVLAKNMIAKNAGVKTGDVYWQAQQKCGKDLIEIQADFSAYLKMSGEVRKIYEDYTDCIEAFGIDECWLDVTASAKLFGSGEEIAETIRKRIKDEIGLTVSIGVSWNKIFSKLGSDMKKPDAVTVITKDNYKDIVWSLPVEDLLYVGKQTKQKLNKYSIYTIGDLANASEEFLVERLGKWGNYLYNFANGNDFSNVVPTTEAENVKSIGNSLTVYRDLVDDDDVKMLIYLLADSITMRMRESGLTQIQTVHIYVRANNLASYHKQGRLPYPSGNIHDIAILAFKLFKEIYSWDTPIRGVGISVSNFYFGPEQLDLFETIDDKERRARLNEAIDKIRRKHGNNMIQLAVICKDARLKDLNIKGEHVIHPYSFFRHS